MAQTTLVNTLLFRFFKVKSVVRLLYNAVVHSCTLQLIFYQKQVLYNILLLHTTLMSLIVVAPRLLIFFKKSTHHHLILHTTFILFTHFVHPPCLFHTPQLKEEYLGGFTKSHLVHFHHFQQFFITWFDQPLLFHTPHLLIFLGEIHPPLLICTPRLLV